MVIGTAISKNTIQMAPYAISSNFSNIFIDFDRDADVLYINFKKPSIATDSEILNDDIIIRKNDGETVGVTIMHASKYRNQQVFRRLCANMRDIKL